MNDSFVRDDLAFGELAPPAAADELLRWARSAAQRAAARDIFRDKEGRRTLRLHYQGHSFFLKLHTGVGWGEIVKNLLQGRLPVVSAANEYHAINRLRNTGVDTLSVAAYARMGGSPASRQSMILTDELVNTVSLEEYCAQWSTRPPPASLRRHLIVQLADSARRMHAAGINHRDFYLCHFHLDPASLAQPVPRCYLIDLHRAQLRSRTPRRWRIKDLAALYFSAMDCGLSRRDLLRFMHHYSAGGLRTALERDGRLWRQVERRARQLQRKGLPVEQAVAEEKGQGRDER